MGTAIERHTALSRALGERYLHHQPKKKKSDRKLRVEEVGVCWTRAQKRIAETFVEGVEEETQDDGIQTGFRVRFPVGENGQDEVRHLSSHGLSRPRVPRKRRQRPVALSHEHDSFGAVRHCAVFHILVENTRDNGEDENTKERDRV